MAVTAASSTLDELIAMLQDDNERRQCILDSRGKEFQREMDVSQIISRPEGNS